MAFPVTITFNRKLKAVITPDNQQELLFFIRQRIITDKADNVVMDTESVRYKGSNSMWRGSLFKGVDDGNFTFVYKEDGHWLIYTINLRQLFIFSAIVAVIMCGFMLAGGGSWWPAFIVFSWLCGGNWISSYLRHGAEATEIAEGIDELICGKPVCEEIEKIPGKLKSWF